MAEMGHLLTFREFKRMSALPPESGHRLRVKSGKVQTEQMFSGLCLKADARRLSVR
jgi:hypothetical protein